MEKLYWYELKNRGISPGAQPDGFVDKDFKHGLYGAVAYDHELSQEEVDGYELERVAFSYSDPVKNYRGLWSVDVNHANGRLYKTVERPTKKEIQEWIKDHKNQFAGVK